MLRKESCQGLISVLDPRVCPRHRRQKTKTCPHGASTPMVKKLHKGSKMGQWPGVEWGTMTSDKTVMEALSVTFEQRPE